MNQLADQTMIAAVGWTLVHFLWQGALLTAGAAGLLHALRRSSAGIRYLAACAGLLLMAACPAVTLWSLLRVAASPAGLAASAPATRLLLAPTPGTPNAHPWLPWIVAAWALGVCGLTVHLLGGWIAAHRLGRSGSPLGDPAVLERIAALQRALGITRPVAARVLQDAATPMVVGCFRAVILVPASALAGLPPAHLEALLAHELAHVRRHDYLVNILQRVVETALFYHPAVWWLSSRVREERENCCDDMAVRALGDRMVYARALASLEEIRMKNRPDNRPVVAANGGSLSSRIRRILGRDASAGAPGFLPVAAVAALLALAGGTALAWQGDPAPMSPDEVAATARRMAAHQARRSVDVDPLRPVTAADVAPPRPPLALTATSSGDLRPARVAQGPRDAAERQAWTARDRAERDSLRARREAEAAMARAERLRGSADAARRRMEAVEGEMARSRALVDVVGTAGNSDRRLREITERLQQLEARQMELQRENESLRLRLEQLQRLRGGPAEEARGLDALRALPTVGRMFEGKDSSLSDVLAADLAAMLAERRALAGEVDAARRKFSEAHPRHQELRARLQDVEKAITLREAEVKAGRGRR